MARVIQGGTAALQAMFYGDPHPAVSQYFESSRGQGLELLKDEARGFFSRAKESFGFLNTESARRAIRDVRRSAQWIFQGDYIRPLRTVEELQMAAPLMRRYLMVQPTIQAMFRQQRLSGYDGGYTDLLPSLYGEDHPDYQRVMQDVLVVRESPEGESLEATHYMEDWGEEHELSLDEQDDIQETWAIALKAIFAGKEDPTSLYGATLE